MDDKRGHRGFPDVLMALVVQILVLVTQKGVH